MTEDEKMMILREERFLSTKRMVELGEIKNSGHLIQLMFSKCLLVLSLKQMSPYLRPLRRIAGFLTRPLLRSFTSRATVIQAAHSPYFCHPNRVIAAKA